MPTPVLRWIPVAVPPDRDSRLREMVLPAAAAFLERVEAVTLELPDLSMYPTPLEKVQLLLHAAAEIEHALLVQYLYAAYSLKSEQELSEPVQKSAVRSWRQTLVEIAREEMGHLMTVQNLLLCTRRPLNFEREDFPPQRSLYPFAMHLEPLTRQSLAKYVVAESPMNATGIDDIIALATNSAGMSVNRVGVLYGLLGVVFSTRKGIIKNAASGDPWYGMVKELAQLAYQMQPPSQWHLAEKNFDKTSAQRQAEDAVWAPSQAVRVFTVASRQACLEALRDIGTQGEGPTSDPLHSHFERFCTMFRGDGTIPPFPDTNEWRPTREVPVDPKVVETPNPAGPNDISAPEAVLWATLANQRYGLLLGLLEQYFHEDPNDRLWIRNWAVFQAMHQLRGLADQLTLLERAPGSGTGKAALPFTLPAELHLPATAEARRQLHVARLRASITTANALLATHPNHVLVGAIKTSDESLLGHFGESVPGGGADPPPASDPDNAEAAMRALLEEKQDIAKFVHGAIPAGGTTLAKLFEQRNYDAILAFLRSDKSIRPPFAGKKLIEPGKPEESGVYLQMSDPSGVMATQFDPAELRVVENWIRSLSTDSASDPGSTSGPAKTPTSTATTDARADMIALLRAKRPIARLLHRAITVDGGTLSQLFESENYDGILQFLTTAKSARAPFVGRPLIVPARPQESAMFLQITDPAGVMVGRFTADEVQVVERWINSLPPAVPIAIGPPAVSSTKVGVKRIATGLSQPVFVVAPPGDARRLFIVEQTGAIRILDLTSGQMLPQPFLQVAEISTGGERGLLGLAFHPKFAANGLFFVNCTNSQGDTEIRRYRVSANPDAADANSRQLVLRIAQPFANHNGGWLAFSPRDGFLYVATGDGGSANDPQNNAQNRNSLLGKILRLDIDRDDFPGDASRNYGIPANNPFATTPNARPEIWAYGLRNPWRCAFDALTGDLYIGDVGQSRREEIDRQPGSSTGGENYGWRLKEGSLDTGLGSTAGLVLVDPIHEYGRGEGFAVIGGAVYRGTASPALSGTYFYADFGGRVWSFRFDGGAIKDLTERTSELTASGATLSSLSSFGTDAAGELYFTTLEGNVYQLQAQTVAVTADRMRDVAKIRIHPAIGVARVGNAGFESGTPSSPALPADYFIGPERPGQVDPPAGGYKRQGRVRRQAARFRLFAYDVHDQLIGEITAADAEITWTVELANRKASFRKFEGPNPNGGLRNPHVTGANREKLDIVPGPRTITGPNQAAAFDTGSFTDWRNGQPRTVSKIYLGGMQTEDSGRLLVLAGTGNSDSPWNKGITHFANNSGWYDTIADGPVNARVRIKNTNATLDAVGAWVICTPPKFAPALRNIITLYDTLFQVEVNRGRRQVPTLPSFKRDIYPILLRAMQIKWIMAAPSIVHDSIQAAFPPADASQRRAVVGRLRHPKKGEGRNGPGMNMPQLFDDSNHWQPEGDEGLAITKAMYEVLEKWRDGQFDNDWDGVAPTPVTEITPDGLDQAALENCAGAAFFPGIEASWLLRDVYDYVEPFRLNPANLRAGDVTRQMAIPWQADFYKCTSDGSAIGWWPQQRPDEVFTESGSQQVEWIRTKIQSHTDMVKHWTELGFVVWNGTRFVETDRNPDSPGPNA